MKKMIMIMIILLCMFSFVVAQVPEDRDSTTEKKIVDEHKKTRKFVSDELTRQKNTFFKEMDSRANYYEAEVKRILASTTIKLSLLWCGIMFFFIGINSFLSRKLEKKRYTKLLEAVKKDVTTDLVKSQKERVKAIRFKEAELDKKEKKLVESKPDIDAIQKDFENKRNELSEIMKKLSITGTRGKN